MMGPHQQLSKKGIPLATHAKKTRARETRCRQITLPPRTVYTDRQVVVVGTFRLNTKIHESFSDVLERKKKQK
jgi:hypothetical protein